MAKNIKNKGSLQVRQGDVLFVSKKSPKLKPETLQRWASYKKSKTVKFKDEGRIAFAYGEVSGHAHACYEQGAIELNYSNDIQETLKHYNATKEAEVVHQEHGPVKVPEGEGFTRIQQEFDYSVNVSRRTAD